MVRVATNMASIKPIREAAKQFRRGARRRAPHDTGDLKRSIRIERSGALSYDVIVGEPYGVYVEFGTETMAAQPYMRPTMDHDRAIIEATLVKSFRRGIPALKATL